MILSINDFTSYWRFDDDEHPTQYIGILFGENILVYNDQVINLTKLLNENGRIYNAIYKKKKLYVLLDNNNLYKIITTNFAIYELICINVKNIFSYDCGTFILQNNGNVLDDKLRKIHEGISVVANIPRCHVYYRSIYVCDTNNLIFKFYTSPKKFAKLPDITKVDDMCIASNDCIVLCNDGTAITCNLFKEKIISKKFWNVNCISAVEQYVIGVIYDDYNIITYKVDEQINEEFNNPVSYKGVSILNSPYCAKFNAQTIPYYPKYFMDRFMVFVMSVKYGCNIKLPKYLYFIIANYLK